jgi:hypothetical protein
LAKSLYDFAEILVTATPKSGLLLVLFLGAFVLWMGWHYLFEQEDGNDFIG